MSLIEQLAGPAKLPVRLARAVAPAQGDLPVYAAAGALVATGVLEWPVAATIGIGYTVVRRWGLHRYFAEEGPQIGDDLVAEPVDTADGDAVASAPTEEAAEGPASRPAHGRRLT